MASETAKSRRLEQGEDNVDFAVPYGIIHIIPSPGMYAVFSPLASAISSGNCVVLAVSNIAYLTHNFYPNSLLAATNNKPLERSITDCVDRDVESRYVHYLLDPAESIVSGTMFHSQTNTRRHPTE